MKNTQLLLSVLCIQPEANCLAYWPNKAILAFSSLTPSFIHFFFVLDDVSCFNFSLSAFSLCLYIFVFFLLLRLAVFRKNAVLGSCSVKLVVAIAKLYFFQIDSES